MARRKAAEEKTEDQGEGVQRVQADQGSIAIGGIHIGRDLSGSFTIGYTAEQVSLLLAQITTKFQPRPFSGECPYKGLEVFEEEDAGLFFGRERLVEELIGRVKESRTVFITGPSGSGKSSLVRAGLIHALKEGAIKNSQRWLYETMKPGREPLKDLALAFSRLKGPDLADYFQAHVNEIDILHRCAESALSGRKDQRFVLFVDQFEEVFTQVNQEADRLAFLKMLAHAGTVEGGRVIVLFAMRSDFVSNCAAYPAINELLSGQFRQIGAMQPEELVSAIALPAKTVGLPVEEELIARIINDMKGEPGALPLMQFALKELFEARQAKGGNIALTLEDYLEREGIQKMLARHADATLNGLSPHQQELARSVFGGLIEIGKGRQDTRRTALFEELVPADTKTEEVEAVVQKFADARLVITDEQAGKDTVTISHERLISAWPWLEKLINENRDVIALQNEIANDAKEWDDHRRDPSYLYTGARLANAREKLEANKIVLSGLAYEFVDTGQAQQRRSQRTRMIGVAIPIGLVILAILVVSYIINANSADAAKRSEEFANTQRASASTSDAFAAIAQTNAEEARKQTTVARAGELAAYAAAVQDQYFDLSLLLSVAAFETDNNTQTKNALLNNTQANLQLRQYLRPPATLVRSMAFSPGNKIMALGSCTVLDNPIGSCDQGEIVLFDVTTGQRIGDPMIGPVSPVEGRGAITSIAFSPDGKTLVSGDDIGTILLWDIKAGTSIDPPLQEITGQPVSSLAFSPDGKTLASSTLNTITLWDLATRQPLGKPITDDRSGRITPESLAFSLDGTTLTAVSPGDLVKWDLATGKMIGQPLPLNTSTFTSMALSLDGKMLAFSDSTDNIITLWDLTLDRTTQQSLAGHSDEINSLAFSPDGKTLASSSADGNLILWDTTVHQPLTEPLKGNYDGISNLAFRPDGKTMVSSSLDNTVILWSTAEHRPMGKSVLGHGLFKALSQDGKILASYNSDEKITLWDTIHHVTIGQMEAHDVTSLAFSGDGKILASGNLSGAILLWNTSTGKPIGQSFEVEGILVEGIFVGSLALSADGKILAAAGDSSHKIILWDTVTGEPIGLPLNMQNTLISKLAFSPDAKILVSGGEDSTVILWNVRTQQQIGQPLKGLTGSMESLAFSPDGYILAGASCSMESENYPYICIQNEIFLWDVTTGQAISHQSLKAGSGLIDSLAFSQDATTLASGGCATNTNGDCVDGEIILWNLSPIYWMQLNCQRAGRNFTRAEWAQYFQDEDYRPTCPQWPLEPEAIPAASPTP